MLGYNFLAFAHRPLLILIKGAASQENIAYQQSDSLSTPDHTPGHFNSPSIQNNDEPLASLVCAICACVKAHPELLPIFLQAKSALKSDRDRAEGVDVVSSSTGSSNSAPSPASALPYIPFTSTTTSTRSPASSYPFSAEHPVHFDFPIFSFLLKFLHRQGKTGQYARQGLVFLIECSNQSCSEMTTPTDIRTKEAKKVSSSSVLTGTSISSFSHGPIDEREQEELQLDDLPSSPLDFILRSDFANVLGASLGAAYSLLPRKLFIPLSSGPLTSLSTKAPRQAHGKNVDDENYNNMWQKLRGEGVGISSDVENKQHLDLFLSLLEFAQDVVRIILGQSIADSSRKKREEIAKKILASIR